MGPGLTGKGKKMSKYHIKPKRDFGNGPGFWCVNAGDTGTGKYGFVKSGFVVTDGGIINVMPGATWFRTIREALEAISCLEASNGNSATFWNMIRALHKEAA